jgi:hypothetical protein
MNSPRLQFLKVLMDKDKEVFHFLHQIPRDDVSDKTFRLSRKVSNYNVYILALENLNTSVMME